MQVHEGSSPFFRTTKEQDERLALYYCLYNTVQFISGGENMKTLNQRKGFSLIFSILFNAVIMLFMLIVFDAEYEIADDVIFSQLITDGYCNIIFLNYFLTKFIGIVQNLIYPISAYVLIDLALAYLSMCTITKIFVDKFEVKKAAIMMLFVNGFFAVDYYLTISFTRLPGVLAVAGFSAIIHYTKQRKWAGGTVWGIILVVLSSLYRFNVFEMMFAIAIAFVAAISFNDYFDTDKSLRKFIDLIKIIFEPKRLISAVIILAVAIPLNIVSNNINTSTEELSHYAEYTSARSLVWDYEIPSYEQASEEYDAIGIDENDLELLDAGFVDEDGAFSLEQLQNIRQIKENNNRKNFSVINAIFSTIKNVGIQIINLTIEGLSVIALGLAFVLYFVFQKKNKYLAPFLIAAAAAVCYLYLGIMGRLVFRVLFTIFFSAFCYILYMYDFSKIKDKSENTKVKSVLAVVCILLISFAGLYATVQRNEHIHYYPTYEEANQINEYIKENQDKKFEMARDTSFSCGMPNTVSDIYHQKKTDYSVNYKTVNCTYYLSPFYNYQLEQFGTDNFYSNLLKDDVYFVVNNNIDYSENMQQYLQKYYSDGQNVSMELVEKLDNYTVYNYALS